MIKLMYTHVCEDDAITLSFVANQDLQWYNCMCLHKMHCMLMVIVQQLCVDIYKVLFGK